MPCTTSILVLGATGKIFVIGYIVATTLSPVSDLSGYIGGSILSRLLSHPDRTSLEITSLVRSSEKAKTFKSEFGVHAIVGSLSDHELIASLAEKAQVVITAVCRLSCQYRKLSLKLCADRQI